MSVSYKVVRVRHKGELYHPVLRAPGVIVGPDELRVLADAPSPQARTRKFDCIFADESPLRDGRPGLRPHCLRVTQDSLELKFEDTGLTIGTIMDAVRYPAGVIPGTQGQVLTGTVQLHETVLADVAWLALVKGLFGGVCLVIGEEQRDMEGVFQSGVLLHAVLGHLEGCCVPTAHVLAGWEEEKSGTGESGVSMSRPTAARRA